MNVPTNMRKFDLQQAIAGAPLVTRDNRPAKCSLKSANRRLR